MSGQQTRTQYLTMVKREFWESRALWLAPLVVAGLILLLSIAASLFAGVTLGGKGVSFRTRVEMGDDPLAAGALGLVSQIGFVGAVVCIFYLLDSLYAERKDRSILFWKSLPVSDASTVLVKYAVAMAIVPLGVFALSLLIYPLIYAIAAMGVPQVVSASGGWSTTRWLQAEAFMFGSMLVTLLWYAPLGAWAMLSSVVSRRSPFLIAVMPFVVAAICENIVLQSAYVWKFIGSRLRPAVHPLETLTEPALWIGLAVAAGMLYMVIRLRRYRDDT